MNRVMALLISGLIGMSMAVAGGVYNEPGKPSLTG